MIQENKSIDDDGKESILPPVITPTFESTPNCSIPIIYMARTFMVHVSLHWSECRVDDLALWGIAVKHAAWLQN